MTIHATNTTDAPKRVGLVLSLPHMVGMGGFTHCRITDSRGRTLRTVNRDDRASVVFSHSKPKISKRVEGSFELSACQQSGVDTRSTNGWWYPEFFEVFNSSQILPDPRGEAFALTDAGAVSQGGSMGAVGGTKTVLPGETFSQRFIIAWHFPDRPCNDGAKVYRNMYAKYLPDVSSVTDYVNENMTMLETETRAWQDRLLQSNLPAWFSRKLCNNISHFSTGAVYADDGRCSFNESPIIMNGCMGTIDQRIASHTPCTLAFPKLGKSDLEMFCDTQITADSDERYAPHWNQKTGQFDARLDRVGAVKHNIGRDDFEGGSTDHTKWLTTHWPDRIPGFILELYMQAAWTGDRDFLEHVYPKILDGIAFQQRLDQNDDGIGDVWGHGCGSFDSKRFDFYGASAYVATMWLAGFALRAKNCPYSR